MHDDYAVPWHRGLLPECHADCPSQVFIFGPAVDRSREERLEAEIEDLRHLRGRLLASNYLLKEDVRAAKAELDAANARIRHLEIRLANLQRMARWQTN